MRFREEFGFSADCPLEAVIHLLLVRRTGTAQASGHAREGDDLGLRHALAGGRGGQPRAGDP